MNRKHHETNILTEVDLILNNNSSLREVSNVLNIPHTTVWWHIHKILSKSDKDTYEEVKKVLKTHKN